MNKALYFVSFVAGAAIGSAATWYLVKTKYEKLADEEIESVKKAFVKRPPVKKEKVDYANGKPATPPFTSEKPNIMEYSRKLQEENYINYAKTDEEPLTESKDAEHEKPIYIPPEDFGEIEEYTQVSWTYYADGILADDADEPVVEIDDHVGADFNKHFGEYEDDSVYVRNDYDKVYYEILRSLQTYEEVSGRKPKPVEIK